MSGLNCNTERFFSEEFQSKLARQGQIVMREFAEHDRGITDGEARDNHRIHRLAAVVERLRKKGVPIITTFEKDGAGHHARYFLLKEKS